MKKEGVDKHMAERLAHGKESRLQLGLKGLKTKICELKLQGEPAEEQLSNRIAQCWNALPLGG